MKKILLLLMLAPFACKKEKEKELQCYTCQVIERRVPQPYISLSQSDTTEYQNCNIDTVTAAMEGLSSDAHWYIYRKTTCTQN